MISKNIKGAWSIAKSTSKILIDARNEMIKSSFGTAKETGVSLQGCRCRNF